ncbi:alpha/beta hydrolase [Sphingomonas kyungheensis]|uniref:Alpha/beta hydrolase-fold protein n=1 Tax=Sphingomonas kyungheensis TaxID=1069987 RepID=A0ABU8GZ85_9SPHN
MIRLPLLAAALALFGAASAPAQVATPAPPPVAGAKPVTVERITVHAPSVEGNLEGNSADRAVLVVLPPGYRSHPKQRYPVVYALHGYSIGVEQWVKEIHVPQTVEGAFAQGTREMIVVLPDSKTMHNGSFYSSSVTVGDFETFVARNLVAYIDGHYRTLADRRSRGLAGHSMGGYGTARIGMKHPETFGALYMMSPCCLSTRALGQTDAAAEATIRALRSPADSASLPWGLRAQLATAAAWSPDPKAPPLFLDLPVKDGVSQPDVLARWAANAPLAMLDQYAGNLKRYAAIGIDVGDRDGLKDDAARLHDGLDRYGIANSFTVYPGDHVSGVAGRVQGAMLPFFGRALAFGR